MQNIKSPTIQNLEAAFAGESMAHIKYMWFARQCRKLPLAPGRGAGRLGLRVLQEVEPRLRGMSPADIRHLNYAIEYGVGSPQFEVQEIAL